MRIKKVWNNNIISSEDESGEEVLLMGNGIGWNVKAGAEVEETKVEKIFRKDKTATLQQLKQIFTEVSLESIQITNDIVKYANQTINLELNKNIYLTLTDHIDFAIERSKGGLTYKNALFWEVQRIYKKEFEVGMYALDIIKDRTGLELVIDEAASVAIHLVNAETDRKMENTVKITEIIRTSLNIVKLYFKVTLDETSFDYQRFIRHLTFFAERVITGEGLDKDGGQDSLFELLQAKYKEEMICAKKIMSYVHKEYGTETNNNEILFLAIHICRVLGRS